MSNQFFPPGDGMLKKNASNTDVEKGSYYKVKKLNEQVKRKGNNFEDTKDNFHFLITAFQILNNRT